MRYLLGFLIAIGLIILVFIIILKSVGHSPTKAPTPLISYANSNTVVEMTVDGPETADQTHQSVNVTVGQTQAVIDIIQGYEGNVTNSKTYTNNEPAYAVFLRALDIAGFNNGDTSQNLTDYRGYCPTGDRYIFTINDNGNTLQQFWTTSCGGQGSLKGDEGTIQELFQDQIPEYGELTNNVNI